MTIDPKYFTGIVTDQPVQVILGEQSSDRWHRFLNALWDEGVIDSLSDRAYRLLGALLRLRREDGTAFAPMSLLSTMCKRYAERTIRAALAELRDHPRRLLAVLGRDVFAILPGWVFAGRRRQDSIGGTAVPELGTAVPPERHNCAVLGTTVPPTCVPPKAARAHGSSIPLESKDNNNQTETGAAVVEVLLAGGFGFSQEEAGDLARLPNVDACRARNALAGALRTKRAGKLRVTPERDVDACARAWVAQALRKQWNLFDQAAADRHVAELRAKNAPRLLAEFKAKCGTLFDSQEGQCALSALGGWEGAFREVDTHHSCWRLSSIERIAEILRWRLSMKGGA